MKLLDLNCRRLLLPRLLLYLLVRVCRSNLEGLKLVPVGRGDGGLVRRREGDEDETINLQLINL